MTRRFAHRAAAVLTAVFAFVATGLLLLKLNSDFPTSTFILCTGTAGAVTVAGTVVMVLTSEPPKIVPGQENPPASRPAPKPSLTALRAAAGALAGHLHHVLRASLAAALALWGHLPNPRLSRRPKRTPGRHEARASTEENERLADTAERGAVEFQPGPVPALDVDHEEAPEALRHLPEAQDDPGPLYSDGSTLWRMTVSDVMGAMT